MLKCVLGWFLLLSSILGFARVKRWERSITTPTPASQVYTAEQVVQDQTLQTRLTEAFLFDAAPRSTDEELSGSPTGEGEQRHSPSQQGASPEEEHIRRDLRSLGLI